VRKDFALFNTDLIDKLSRVDTQVQKFQLELHKVNKQNLIIQGLKKKKHETWKNLETVIKDLYKKLRLEGTAGYDDCFRLGKPKDKARPVLLKLIRQRDKKLIMSHTKNLKGSNTYMNDDLSGEESRIEEGSPRGTSQHPAARVFLQKWP
jgi:predicted nuclease with TOPRIM domain